MYIDSWNLSKIRIKRRHYLALFYTRMVQINNTLLLGPLHTDYTIKYGAVFIIFLVSGLSLKTDNIFHTFRQYKLHIFIQVFTFIFIPIFTQVIVKILLILRINIWILKGYVYLIIFLKIRIYFEYFRLITVACMPPPVSSAVILTRAAQGNETAAIFNSVLGSFLGIIITPISLLFNVSFNKMLDIGPIVYNF